VSERSSGQHVQCRPYWARWIAIPVAAVLLGVSVYAATRLQASDTGVDFRVSDQIAMVGLGVVLALVALSPMRPRVRADAEGVSVRNVLFSRRFDWGEVRSVSFPDGASFPRLELAEDEYYSVLAVQAMDRQRAVDAVRGLRRLHRAALSRVAAAGQAGTGGEDDSPPQPDAADGPAADGAVAGDGSSGGEDRVDATVRTDVCDGTDGAGSSSAQ